MSQEPEEKPKLNIVIVHDHEQIMIRTKANLPLQKAFQAAHTRFGKEPGTLRFIYEGRRIQGDESPASLGMEDGDQIDAHLMQVGGGFWSQIQS